MKHACTVCVSNNPIGREAMHVCNVYIPAIQTCQFLQFLYAI